MYIGRIDVRVPIAGMKGPVLDNKYKRKVQLTGSSTYIVSLPKDWIRRLGIKQGCEVLINIMPDNSLKITPLISREKGEEPPRIKLIQVKNISGDALVIEMISAYLAGYDQIILEYPVELEREIIGEVEKVQAKTVGLEVLEEEPGRLKLYMIVDNTSLSIHESLEKMMSIAVLMIDNALKFLKEGEKVLLQSIVRKDDTVDKLFLLIMRQLNQVLSGRIGLDKTGLKTYPEIAYLVIVAKSIERIADHAVLLSKYITKMDPSRQVYHDIYELLDLAKQAYMLSIRGFRLHDTKLALKALNKIGEAEQRLNDFMETLPPSDGLNSIYPVLESINRIIAYSRDIVEATYNLATYRELIGYADHKEKV